MYVLSYEWSLDELRKCKYVVLYEWWWKIVLMLNYFVLVNVKGNFGF